MKILNHKNLLPVKQYTIIFLFLFLSKVGFAQQNEDWIQVWDTSQNFYTIQNAFNAYWNPIVQNEVPKAKSLTTPLLTRDVFKENVKPGWVQFKRWEAFMEPRVFPSGDVTLPSSNLSEFQKYLNTNVPGMNPLIMPPSGGAGIIDTSAGNTAYPSANGSFVSLGPSSVPSPGPGGGGAGRVNCIRFNPLNTKSIWIGTPAGGLWHSVDSGTTWTTNTDALTMLGVSDLLIHPTDTNIMYLGTGDGDAGDTYSLGVLKSTDAGATWGATGLSWLVTNKRVISRLIMDPTNPNVILAATSNGIYRTTNGGTNWSVQTTPASGDFKDIEFKPGNSNVVYAAKYSTAKFYRSTDNGINFTEITSGLPASGTDNRYAIGVSAADSNYVYVLGSLNSGSGFGGVYRSVDGGLNFTTRSTTPNCLGWDTGGDSGGQGWYTLSIAVSPSNRDSLVIGGVNIWSSGNGGTNWTQISHWYGGFSKPYVHADIHALEYLPGNSGVIFSGCDGGVFKTINSGTTWYDKSNTLCIAQQYKLGTSVTASNKTITGHQDNGTNFQNSGVWTQVYGGDGMECVIDHTISTRQFSALYYGAIDISINDGATYPYPVICSSGGTAGTVNENGNWVTPYIMNPLKNTTMLVGKTKVYRSYNIGIAGVTFSSVGDITTAGTGRVVAMAYAPSDTNFIYVAKNDAFFASYNSTSFNNRTTGLPVGSASITYIAVSNTDPKKVWVTFSGYSAANKIFASIDSGVTWTNYSTGLPNLPANCVVYENGSSNDALYVGTDVGVYYRNSSLSSWQPFFNGLPNVIVAELEIQYSSSKLRAATYGRGLWESDLYSTLKVGFSGTPLIACTNAPIVFTDTSVGVVTNYSWNFGSGASSATATTVGPHSVTYTTTGTKTIFLSITGPEGSDSVTKVNYVNIVAPGVNGGAGTWTWTGTVSNDWFDPCNWDQISLPDILSDVIVSGTTPFQPSISGATASCRTITVSSGTGGILTINSAGGGVLDVAL